MTGGSDIHDSYENGSARTTAEQEIKKKENAELTRLIKKAMRGSTGAFENLYKRYIKEIIYHARNLLATPEDAEDAAQEIIIALYRNIRGLKSPYAFKSYLLKTVYSVCATRNRAKREPTEQVEDYEEILEDTSDLGPQGSLDQLELSEALKKAIAKLPAKQRETLTLRYYDDLEYEEIAQLLKVSVGTVGSNVLRAKKALKYVIEQDDSISSQGEGTYVTTRGKDILDTGELGQQPSVQGAVEHRAEQEQDLPGGKPNDYGPQTLKGAAMGPAVAVALSEAINETVNNESVKGVVAGVSTTLASGTAAVAATKLGMGATIKAWILVAVVAGSLVAGGAAVSYQYERANSINVESTTVTPAGEYNPAAQIEFGGGNIASDTTNGTIEQINPTEARIVLESGTAVGWAITDSAGTIVAEGSGANVQGTFETLPPGQYTLTWTAQNEESSQAYISREFAITE